MTEIGVGFGDALFRIIVRDRGPTRVVLHLSGRPPIGCRMSFPDVDGLIYPGTYADFTESYATRECCVHITRERDREVAAFTVSRRIAEHAIAHGRGPIEVDLTLEVESVYRNVTAAMTISATNERMIASERGLNDTLAALADMGRMSEPKPAIMRVRKRSIVLGEDD